MTSYAPYNFIPFAKKVNAPYTSKGTLPKHNEVTGNSGRITYTITNLTPISVGDEKEGFCQNGRGEYIIPGSTLRGFFRTHAEIISASYPEYISDDRYMYRSLAGRWNRREYSEKIGSSQNIYKLPEGVQAGYISKENNNYYMQPLKPIGDTGHTFLQVPERSLIGILRPDQYMMNRDRKPNRNYKPYRNSKETEFCILKKNNKNTVVCRRENESSPTGGWYKGRLLNSEAMFKKTHHYIVSSQEASNEKKFEIPYDDVLAYRGDYERNCIQNAKLKKYELFYALPRSNERKIFFYKLKEGKLVGFGATPYFRIFYNHSVGDGIRMEHHEGHYDFAQALFGYTGTTGKGQNDSYKGRVSFEDAVLGADVKLEEKKAYFGSPKGTAFQMYLKQPNERRLDTYNSNSMQLRGYKFYWKRDKAWEDSGGQTNVTMQTIPEGNCFSGTIYFENLNDKELGLLLCTLQIGEAGETYSIGKGKPYGYGKIAINDIKVYKSDNELSFSSLEHLEEDYTKEALQLRDNFKNEILQNPDYCVALSEYIRYATKGDTVDESKLYMSLDEYKYRNALPTAKQIRNKEGK